MGKEKPRMVNRKARITKRVNYNIDGCNLFDYGFLGLLPEISRRK